MGHVVSIEDAGSRKYDNPANRADLYFAEAERFTKAAGEAVRQIEDEAERIRAQTRFLRIANRAMEELVES